MQQFLKSAECPMMLQVLEDQNVWALFDKEDTCPHGVLHLARALAAECPDSVQNCVDDLSSSLTSIYDAHRITVVAFYSEVCKRCCVILDCLSVPALLSTVGVHPQRKPGILVGRADYEQPSWQTSG